METVFELLGSYLTAIWGAFLSPLAVLMVGVYLFYLAALILTWPTLKLFQFLEDRFQGIAVPLGISFTIIIVAPSIWIWMNAASFVVSWVEAYTSSGFWHVCDLIFGIGFLAYGVAMVLSPKENGNNESSYSFSIGSWMYLILSIVTPVVAIVFDIWPNAMFPIFKFASNLWFGQ